MGIRGHPPWVSVGVRMCSVVLGILGYSLVSVLIRSSPEYPWVSVDSVGIRMQSRLSLGLRGYPWVSVCVRSSPGYPWVFVGVHGYSQ